MKRHGALFGIAATAYIIWAWVIAPIIFIPLSALVFCDLLPRLGLALAPC